MTNKETAVQPDALLLADVLEQFGGATCFKAAAELRRLHAQVEVLSAAQTELAAMRAEGEPVAEMVPCYTPSGKRVAVISRFQHLPIGTKLYTHPSPPEGMAAEQALLKVLAAVQRYLPPDGPSEHDTLTEIIEVVDPWPLGQLDKS